MPLAALRVPHDHSDPRPDRRLKAEWTDQYEGERDETELARFADRIGRVVTVNWRRARRFGRRQVRYYRLARLPDQGEPPKTRRQI